MTTIDPMTCPIHVLAEQVAPCAPPDGSTAALWLAELRDSAIAVIDEYDDLDAWARDALGQSPHASVNVWTIWTELRLWQDEQCAIVLAAADLNMVADGSLDLTDVARVAVQVVGHRILELLRPDRAIPVQ